MRVVNDREEKTEPSELVVLQVISYALFCAAGISTVVFCPFPMILAHLRLSDSMAKLSGLLGALIALTLLEIPAKMVVLTFIFGMWVADGVARRRGFWRLLATACLVAAFSAVALLAFQAANEKVGMLTFWHQGVHSVVDQIQKGIQTEGALKWDQLEALLLFEGPFLYLAFAILSFWLSVGLTAHLGWFPELHPFVSDKLRRISVPPWFPLLFAALLFGSLSGAGDLQKGLSGLVRVVGAVLFVQGCISLSALMHQRDTRHRVRTLVYIISIVFGFYALIALGLVGPWLKRRTARVPAET